MYVSASTPSFRQIDALPTTGGRASAESAYSPTFDVTPQPLYLNPRLRFDRDANVVVIEIRNLDNGELERTIPTKSQLDAYERAARIARQQPLPDEGDRAAERAAAERAAEDAVAATGAGQPERASAELRVASASLRRVAGGDASTAAAVPASSAFGGYGADGGRSGSARPAARTSEA